MHAAFTRALAQRLEACGLAARVATAVGLATDTAEMTASARSFEADTVLVVWQSGGNIVQGGAGDLVFDLELIELASSKVTWRARVKLGFLSPRSSSDAVASGRNLDAGIVARLRHDHAIAGCPAL
jgi:hypothetical protein